LLFTEHLQQAVIKDAQVEMLQAPNKNGPKNKKTLRDQQKNYRPTGSQYTIK